MYVGFASVHFGATYTGILSSTECWLNVCNRGYITSYSSYFTATKCVTFQQCPYNGLTD